MGAIFLHGRLRLEVAKNPHARRRPIAVRVAGATNEPPRDEVRESPWRRLMQWFRELRRSERPSALAAR